MALTIRKKSGLIVPATPKVIIPGKKDEMTLSQRIIEKEIKNIIKESVGIKNKSACKRIDFFPVYRTVNGEKEIFKLYMKNRYTFLEVIIDVNSEIESKGIMLLEFLDYIIIHIRIVITFQWTSSIIILEKKLQVSKSLPT